MKKRAGMVAVAVVAFVLGGIAIELLPRVYAQSVGEIKEPKWQYGVRVRARKHDEKDFGEKSSKWVGIEVYRDENNGNLIYVTEAGSIAVVPAK